MRLCALAMLVGLVLCSTAAAFGQAPAPTQRPVLDLVALLREGDQLLDVDDVVEKALVASPDVQAARAELRQADAQGAASVVELLPRLSVTASYHHLFGVEDFRFQEDPELVEAAVARQAAGTPAASSPLESLTFPQVPDLYRARLEVSIPLTDVLRRTLPMLAAADHLERSRRMGLRAARHAAALLSYAAYYEYFRARAQVFVAEASLRDAQLHRDEVALQIDAGTLGRVAMLPAEVRVQRVAIALEQARVSKSIAHDRLEQVMRTELPLEIAIAEPIASELPSAAGDVKHAHERALRMRPELVALRRLVRSRQSEEDAAHASSVPRLRVFAGTDIEDPKPRTFPQRSGVGVAWDVGVTLSWSPNDVAGNAFHAEAADARTAAARAQLRHAEDEVRDEVSEAFHQLEALRQSLATARSGLRAAEENHEPHLLLFRAGRIPSSELRDAEEELRLARRDFVDIAFALRLAGAQLKYALGEEL